MKSACVTSLLLVATCSHACAAFPTSIHKAVIEPSMIRQAVELEKRISSQAALSAPPGESSYVVIKGDPDVIITAPHATEPFRNGSYRFSDGAGTAALADQLHRTTCATVLYTQYRSASDPNFYDDNAFKAELAALIATHKPKLLLDIHGSHDYRPYDVDLGTLNGQSLQGQPAMYSRLVASLRREGITNLSDNYFPAQANQTITRFAASKGVPAIQLEISSTRMRPSEGGIMAHRFAQLLQGLTRYVRSVSHNPTGKCSAEP